MFTAFDKIPEEKVKGVTKTIEAVVSRFHGMYFQRIWDRVQTHAVYGVTEDTMDILRDELKKIGAMKFRKIKANGRTLWILTFSAEKIK
jgi:hypothetical protein